MIGAGLPEPVARVFASFDAAAAAGNLAGSPADFKALTGRDPQSFEDWFASNAAPVLTQAS
jgi:NAD(P)H dehydrogenase (quinone)